MLDVERSKARAEAERIRSAAMAEAEEMRRAAASYLEQVRGVFVRERRECVDARQRSDAMLAADITSLQRYVQGLIQTIEGQGQAANLEPLRASTRDMLRAVIKLGENTAFDNTEQMLKELIAFYNLILDSNRKHKAKAKKSGDPDYMQLAENCSEFLEYILDIMADFGAEEIKSPMGTVFQASIHELKATAHPLSLKDCVVRRSVRSGFRFRDNILQKELVTVYQREVL
jgi:molecular chaperone GrpE (heat shock protein)